MSDVRRVDAYDINYSTIYDVGAIDNDGGTHALMPWSEYERLRAEVERLKSREISDEQIDEAWEYAHENGGDFQAVCMITLDCIGIVECPECGGSGTWRGVADHDQTVEETDVCVICDGHCWIREESGDE